MLNYPADYAWNDEGIRTAAHNLALAKVIGGMLASDHLNPEYMVSTYRGWYKKFLAELIRQEENDIKINPDQDAPPR